MKLLDTPLKRTLAVLGFTLLGTASVLAQSDDFNAGNDTGWTRFGLDSQGLPAPEYSFPSDGNGGKAYRIYVAPPPIAAAGPARAFPYRAQVSYSDCFLAVDVINFDNSLNQAFGFVFRASNFGLGKTDGYVMNYDPNQASGGRGQLQINRIHSEAPSTLCAANLSLTPNKRYRFTLSCVGTLMTGRVYDLDDLTAPLATIVADEGTYPTGNAGLFVFSRVNSSSYTSPAGACDATFDNFMALPMVPQTVDLPATPPSNPFAPYIANRLPISRANFYPAASGLSFYARSGPVNTLSASGIKVFLNGQDVSSGLSVTGDASNLSVAYSGLASNKFYTARIELKDSGGVASTNSFNFDTFTEAYLTNTLVKVIEAEDYNYDNGKYQDNPPVSGISNSGVQVRGSGVGYLDLVGVPGVDYNDVSTSVGSGTAPDYRNGDFVGTQGNTAAEVQSLNPTVGPLNDTIRQKYSADDLPEYHVRRTEGGEWLNYTRRFAATNYNVFLRVACRAPQQVLLDKVTSDATQPNQTTSPLGVFNVSNSGMTVNFQYVPLVDNNGNVASISLDGLQTLRTTFGGSPTNVTQYTMTVNYLLFVPAAAVATPTLTLEAADTVSGNFAAMTSAVIDTTAKTITIARPTSNKFLRVSGATKVKLAGTSLTSNSLVINYAPAP